MEINRLPARVAFKAVRMLGVDRRLSDERYLRLQYRALMGKPLNLENPTTFNEKLQWLKLHDRNPLYTTFVDKYAVKQWVADKIGVQYVVPTLGVWDRAEDIDISDLPERFVLKTNHDCGGIAICRDRESFDLDAAKHKLAEHLERNYYWGCREWPYKDVVPRVFAEEYLEPVPTFNDLMDYKVFTFGGEARCIQVDYDRFANHRRVFYDRAWERLPFTTCYPTDPSKVIPMPRDFCRLLSSAETLAREAGCPAFARVDFYCREQGINFGEMTFYHGAGLERFDPSEWDEVLGSWINLSKANSEISD